MPASQPLAPVRFLHAADFRLDTPCYGLGGLPTALRDHLVEARYRAAENVFTAAIEGHVDFVALAGGLLDVHMTGLRGPWFLAEQFARLREAGIEVYWSGGSLDAPHRWPEYVPLPDNVHFCTSGPEHPLTFRRDGRSAQIIGLGRTISPSAVPFVPTEETFNVVIIADAEDRPLCWPNVDYWALGGRPRAHRVSSDSGIAWYSGSPQGRQPDECGPHEALLVTLTPQERHVEPIPTDTVRWHRIRLTADHETATADINEQLRARCHELAADHSVCVHFLTVELSGHGLALQRWMRPDIRGEMQRALQDQFGRQAGSGCPVWLAEIDVYPDETQIRNWQLEDKRLSELVESVTRLSYSMEQHAPKAIEPSERKRRALNHGLGLLKSGNNE